MPREMLVSEFLVRTHPLGLFAARALALAVAALQPARADVLTAINAARMEDCPARLDRRPLLFSRGLTAAASRLANGDQLHSALRAVSYAAEQATELHITGATSEAAVSSMLAPRYCSTLSDPGMREVGVARRGKELWIVVAAPLRLPGRHDAASISDSVLALVNRARHHSHRCGDRSFAPVKRLKLNAALSRVALAHSVEMARLSILSHQGKDGSSPADRARAGGYYTRAVVGENIASGVATAEEVVRGWLESPGHCENIMDPRFVDMGVGYAVNPASQSEIYWTQLLAARR
jgi:uncharacterized protein YkwD